MHFETERIVVEGDEVKHARGEEKRAKGPAVNLLTSLPPFAHGDLSVQRTTRTYIRETLCPSSLSLSLSRRTYPSPSLHWHHPQFAFLKAAQKPPEIAAGSSDVTAGSISVSCSPPTADRLFLHLRSRESLSLSLSLSHLVIVKGKRAIDRISQVDHLCMILFIKIVSMSILLQYTTQKSEKKLFVISTMAYATSNLVFVSLMQKLFQSNLSFTKTRE